MAGDTQSNWRSIQPPEAQAPWSTDSLHGRDLDGMDVTIAPESLIDAHSTVVAPTPEKTDENPYKSAVLTGARDVLPLKLLSGEVRGGEAEAEAVEVVF